MGQQSDAASETDAGDRIAIAPSGDGLECLIVLDGSYAATYQFRDAPRKESKSFIAHLGRKHIVTKVILVSGDREAETRHLAQRVGVTKVYASKSPEEKVAMYRQYCGARHGLDGKGDGPTAFTLKAPPPDLTTLTARHMGTFPREYVVNILRFGPGRSAHGPSDMPTWGTIFQVLEKNNERAVQQRIKNITDYLASLQEE